MQNPHKHKTGIRRKVTLVICLATLIVMDIGISLGYLLGYNLLKDSIGSSRVQVAQFLGMEIVNNLRGEIEDIETYATRPLWLDVVKEANLNYNGMAAVDIERRLKEMDVKWAQTQGGDALTGEYLNNRISLSMRDILNLRGGIAELFVTDKYGGLVAASNKTSDFYQADEVWWQEAYNEGKGKVFIGDIEFDESSGKWVIPIAVPLKDKDNNVIGVCKDSVALERIFGRLEQVRIGETAHVIVTDQKGRILFHPGSAPLSLTLFSEEYMHKILSDKSQYQIIAQSPLRKKALFISFSEIISPYLLQENTRWVLFINQDKDEAFGPLNQLIFQMMLLVLILLIIMVPVGYLAGGIFIRPIHELHVATEKILQGNWDYKIEVKTADEIGQFADAFGEMLSNLREKQNQLLEAKKNLEDLTADLENKVQKRTQELSQINEANLNILEDLTEAKHKLEEALRIKSDFTSMVSHELRTPLAAIKEGIAIVSDQTAGALNEKQKEFLNIAQRNVDRLTRIISEILDFQKIEAGRMVFHMGDEDINEIVSEVGKDLGTLLKDKGLNFAINLKSGLPKAKLDRDKIIQVLSNLVNNALKATEKGGIAIATDMGDNFIRVSVQDTGTGIKKEDMPKLFQQFVQLENGATRKPGGTGLGLAICREIVEKHKGKIWAESTFGKGSTFRFILPIKERRN